MARWNINDICYFVSNGSKITPGIITSIKGEFCTVKYSSKAAFRLRSTKLYKTEEEARRHVIINIEMPNYIRKFHSPYDYM